MKSLLGRSQIWLAILTAQVIVAGPSLCMAGLLKHPCECGSMMVDDCCADCCAGERDHGCSREGCSHDDCGNDPCQTRSTGAPSRLGRMDVDLTSDFLATALPVPGAQVIGSRFATDAPSRSGHTPLGPPGVPKRLPYHASDIPLLR